MSVIREADIVYEAGRHWVLRVKNGFEVYRNEATHSVRCGRIGYEGQRGLDRAIEEVIRREPTLQRTGRGAP